MGHIHPDRLKLMAKQGIIPPKYQHINMPFCAACVHDKATRCPWRSRLTNNKDEASTPREPGEVISVDQMTSPTPGLIAQTTGMLTNKRYTCTTIYVDHSSGYSFVWVQKSINTEETLEDKKAFKGHARSLGLTIHQYHANNGVFKARIWVDDCESKEKIVSYPGVGVHH